VISSGLAVEAGYVWVAMVTSSDGPVMTGDHLIADLVRTGLPAPSRVRAIKIACIEPSRIVRRIGRLATDDWRKVRHSLAQFLS
jgi:mRNA interferase MazF